MSGLCPCPGPWGQVLILVLVLGGKVLVLVLVFGGQVLVNMPDILWQCLSHELDPILNLEQEIFYYYFISCYIS